MRRNEHVVGPTVVAWAALVLVCVGSRVATTITYVEDPDSLRFALSVARGFDLAAMQPHFPGYPVFWAVVKPLYLGLGSFSTAFSVVGGLAAAGLVAALLALWRKPLASAEGALLSALVVLNPLVWLMGNRYMPDLLGTACALAAFALLMRALYGSGRRVERAAVLGAAATGLLAGLRLSYLPLLAVPTVVLLVRLVREGRGRQLVRAVLAGLASVAVWLVPMTLDTGWATLIDVATTQTTGHFTEFGGTVQTEPNVARRLAGTVRGLWADGLGGWWPGRHPLTLAVGAGVLGLSAAGIREFWTRRRSLRTRMVVAGLSLATYAAWIFFFQNVIHKSRHVLPLLPFVLLLLSLGASRTWRSGRVWRRFLVVVAVLAYGSVTLVLVQQHRSPSAIAQVKTFLQEEMQKGSSARPRVVSDPLVNTYLEAQQVEARYLSITDTTAIRRALQDSTERTVVVGTYPGLVRRTPVRDTTFYHNPFVNRMWPDVTVRVYGPERDGRGPGVGGGT